MISSGFPYDVRLATLGRDLAKVPFKSTQYYLESVNSSCSMQTASISDNTDGSCNGIYLSVTALDNPISAGKGSRLQVVFTGRKFGFRIRGPQILFPIDVVIDGESFCIDLTNPYLTNHTSVSTGNTDIPVLVTDELEDGIHIAEFILTANQNGGSTKSMLILGLLLEKRCGYVDGQPGVTMLYKSGTLTASQVSLVTGLSELPKKIPLVWYQNTTGLQQIVTVQYNTASRYEIVLGAAGTPTSSYTLAMANSGPISYWTHAASNASAVNYTVFGEP